MWTLYLYRVRSQSSQSIMILDLVYLSPVFAPQPFRNSEKGLVSPYVFVLVLLHIQTSINVLRYLMTS